MALPRFAYSDEEVAALISAISPERLAPYLHGAGHDKAGAIRLYEWNTRVSGALHAPLQAVEVVIRNAFHRQLTKCFGEMWYDALSTAGTWGLEQTSRIYEAKERIARVGKPHAPGRMVAELSFGFWTAICAKRYTATLWIPCLRHAITTPKVNRQTVFERLDGIRVLRNRVAHHEPIFGRNLEADFVNIVQTVRWICPTSAEWIKSTSSFRSALETKASG
jgi:hypothetical protein